MQSLARELVCWYLHKPDCMELYAKGSCLQSTLLYIFMESIKNKWNDNEDLYTCRHAFSMYTCIVVHIVVTGNA